MAGEDKIAQSRRAYEAFAQGDVASATDNLADDVEWIVNGQSAVSGSYRGKEEVLGFFGRLAEKGFSTHPEYWLSDGERVVVLTHVRIGGEEYDGVDVFTYSGDKVTKYQGAHDTAVYERVFGRR
jgi:hypothetical protein